MTSDISVRIMSSAWFKEHNNYMSLDSEFSTYFPKDCFIPRGTGKKNSPFLLERGIDIDYQGAGESVRCFLEREKGGQFRPSNRGAIKKFFQGTEATVGDTIVFTRISPRRYQVSLKKNSDEFGPIKLKGSS